MDLKKFKGKLTFSIFEKGTSHNPTVNAWSIWCFLTVFHKQSEEFLVNKETGKKKRKSPLSFSP